MNVPELRSFIPVNPSCDFPIQNLPYGIFSTIQNPSPRVGVAIGEYVLDLVIVAQHGLLKDTKLGSLAEQIFSQGTLNAFISLDHTVWKSVRRCLIELLREDGESSLKSRKDIQVQALIPQASVKLHLPASIGDYTDFYASKEHATNVGTMFRGASNALMPNWVHLPVGYHGRASSIVVSDTPIQRPWGQRLPTIGASAPIFSPSMRLDFELEMAFLVGGPENPLGTPIPMMEAKNRIFGVVLMNDWSARDIQAWEYVPLGPFLGKNFATTISPWVVPIDALEPFLCSGPKQDPSPLPYLALKEPANYDIHLEVALQPAESSKATIICRSNLKHMYWSFTQQLVHHTVNGCNLRPGDLCGTGTISGPTPDSFGSLLELSWSGQKPITVEGANGKIVQRTFVEDGDRVILSGWAQGSNYRVGFGQASGQVVAAHPPTAG